MSSVSLRDGGGSAFATTSPGGTSSVTVNGKTQTSGGPSSSTGPVLSALNKSASKMTPPGPPKAQLEAMGKGVAERAIANGQTTGLDALIKQSVGANGPVDKAKLKSQIQALKGELGAEAGGTSVDLQSIMSKFASLEMEIAQLKQQLAGGK